MRTPTQKRYAEKNKELLYAKDKASGRSHHNKENEAKNNNQRNSDLGWRWMAWSAHFRKRLTFDYEDLRIVSLKVLENPSFTFIYKEARCTERLFSRLPCFSSKPS